MLDISEMPYSSNEVNYDQLDDLELIFRRISISDDDSPDKTTIRYENSANEKITPTETRVKNSIPVKSDIKNACKLTNNFVAHTSRPVDSKSCSTCKEGGKLSERDDPVLADWEKHSNGIAGKLLKKMGFQPGKGLGKNLQGMTKPIETALRKGKGAIGYYGPEKSFIKSGTTQNLRNNTVRALGNMPIKHSIPNLNPRNDLKPKNNSLSSNITKPPESSDILLNSKSINVIKNFSDVTKLTEVNCSDQPSTSKLRNIGKSIHINTNSIDGKNLSKSMDSNLPEKIDKSSAKPRKAEKLLDTATGVDTDQDENFKLDNKEPDQFEEDPLDILRSHLKNLKIRRRDSKLEKVTKCLKECREACLDIKLVDALDICSDLLKTLESNRNNQVLYEKITAEVTEIISDAVEEEFLYWDAIKESKEGARLMALTREVLLLMPRPLHEKGEVMLGEFEKIVWNVIVPKVKDEIDHWNAKEPKEALALFYWWEPIFNQDMLSDIVDNHLHIKLESTLLGWDPISDAIPVELWIRPWIQMLGRRTRTFYPIIVQKLADALVSLEAEEFNYDMLMKSGFSIVDERTRLSFVVDHIMPKLARYLRGIHFTLVEQDFNQLKTVTDWADWVPMKIVADCLVENFFPKVIRVLSVWLKLIQMPELSLWLAGWLNQIPKKLKGNPSVRQCIDDVMVVMEYGMAMSAKNNF